MGEVISKIPVIVLSGMVVLPDTTVHFDVLKKTSVAALESAMKNDGKIFLAVQKSENENDSQKCDLYNIGIIAEIKQLAKLPSGVIKVLAEGGKRARLLEILSDTPHLLADVCYEQVEDDIEDENKKIAMSRVLKELMEKYIKENPRINKETIYEIFEEENLLNQLMMVLNILPVSVAAKQRVLEMDSVSEQYELVLKYLSEETDISKIKREVENKVRESVEKNQKEYVLREQIKAIRKEMGDEDTSSEADNYLEETEKLNASDEVKEKLKKEIKRFRNMQSGSSDANVIRGYIETLLEMPWNNKSEDNWDIKNAQKIMERDHYGLKDVKERILDYLAVRSLILKNKNSDKEINKAPVICLYGPPGTGKTSIAKSIAEALNKKYIRICLGGVRDEAEIRGHRKTYVGAMPGRLATSLKQAKVSNPLILLDEIDKLASDYKGDPASALLEVLDSEQNMSFRDNYIEVPIDLSQVLFIATANDIKNIPRPLADRMEIIDISGYTANEKEHIAIEHLISKQKMANGLKEKQLTITKTAIKTIINNYTREAGVRNLERTIGKICRKAARELLEEKCEKVKVSDKNLVDYLGKKKYIVDMANEADDVGIVRGLAWTSVGGDTLEIEVNTFKGKGQIILTGQLGDVMKESAQAGISYIKSIAEKYSISEEFFNENDIHIHIPQGAIPKDGPSAGITMATAVISAITGRKVKAKLAMTGEITLRGRVLPIGGLKEKLLAAKTAGIGTVLVPKKNMSDVEEIDDEIKMGLNIIFVENMQQVLKEALV